MVNSRFQDYRYEWPQHIPETRPQNRIRVHALIPNLRHRPERWTKCRELLEEQGFPCANIHRFKAFSHRDYNSAIEAIEHAREYIQPMPRLLSESLFITRNNISELGYLLTWYAMVLRISRIENPNLYFLILIDDCHIIFTYEQIHQTLDFLTRHEYHKPRILQIGRNPRVLLHRPVVPYFDIWQYGLCGRTDPAYLLNREGAKDLICACELLPRELIPAYIFEKLSYFPQQFGYYSLSALYENRECPASFGATHIFESRLEYQDRLASIGYK